MTLNIHEMEDEEQWEDVKGRRKGLKGVGIDGVSNSVFDKEPDFSDPEDFVDDVTDEELVGDILSKEPKEADGYESVIVVDNIPTVGEDRLEKLDAVLTKIFGKFGPIESKNFPREKGGTKTKGYLFIEYKRAEDALEAVRKGDGYRLDKSHTFRVNLFNDIEKYENFEMTEKSVQMQPYKDPGNLQYFLEDEDCFDQFSVIYEGGDKTTIYLNNPNEPSLVEERKRWTETYTRWSPQGTYLATFHQKGIALWGGKEFKQIQRFAHQGVHLIDFSPCERYLVTFSPMQAGRTSDEPTAIVIWDIFTGAKKRAFHADMSGEEDRQWPIFKWSNDGKFFARKSSGVLSIYETPSCGLLDKKSLKVDGIREFSWSPAENKLAYWLPEQNEIPARVTILGFPSRQELRVKNLFNVADIRLHWHKQGQFLCVKVDRYNKTKKANISNFEIFHIKEKQVPVDIVELKEQVTAFAWEPNGSKFCCLHGESRLSASFYAVKSGKVELLETQERKSASHIFWSPAGQFVLLAGLRSSSQLEFIDTADMTIMNTSEHLMVSDIEWDPTGRFVISVVSWWAHKIDNAYWMWSFQGRLLRKINVDRICQLLWRPRPPSLLAEEQIRKVKKDHKKYAKQFEAKDRVLQSRVSKEILGKRRELMEEFLAYRRLNAERYQEQTPYRRELRNGVNTDEVDGHTEDWDDICVEILVDEVETVVD